MAVDMGRRTYGYLKWSKETMTIHIHHMADVPRIDEDLGAYGKGLARAHFDQEPVCPFADGGFNRDLHSAIRRENAIAYRLTIQDLLQVGIRARLGRASPTARPRLYPPPRWPSKSHS